MKILDTKVRNRIRQRARNSVSLTQATEQKPQTQATGQKSLRTMPEPQDQQPSFEQSSWGPNSPTNRRTTWFGWTHIGRLKASDPWAKIHLDKGKTHVCIICQAPLKLTKRTGTKAWVNNAAKAHLEAKHIDLPQVKVSEEKSKTNKRKRIADVMTTEEPPPILGSIGAMRLRAVRQKAVRWYIYSSSRISKSMFDCKLFKDMINTACGSKGGVPQRKDIAQYVEHEFNDYIAFVRIILSIKAAESHGSFIQLQVDGSKLANGYPYQFGGFQFLDPDWARTHKVKNWVLPLMLQQQRVGTGEATAKTLKEAMARMKIDESLVGAFVSDRKALKTGTFFENVLEPEVCNMHDADKIARSAIGLHTRTEEKVVVNAFPEGDEIVQAAVDIGSTFSYSDRQIQLTDLCKLRQESGRTIKVVKSKMRIAAYRGLFTSILASRLGIEAYAGMHHQGLSWWPLPQDFWEILQHFEAILQVTGRFCVQVQSEKHLLAGYCVALKIALFNELKNGYFRILRLPCTEKLPVKKLTRDEVRYVQDDGSENEEIHAVPRECRKRAMIELQRRFGTSNTNAVAENLNLPLTRREKLAHMLDLRLVYRNLEAADMKVILQEEFVKYYIAKHGEQDSDLAAPSSDHNEPSEGAEGVDEDNEAWGDYWQQDNPMYSNSESDASADDAESLKVKAQAAFADEWKYWSRAARYMPWKRMYPELELSSNQNWTVSDIIKMQRADLGRVLFADPIKSKNSKGKEYSIAPYAQCPTLVEMGFSTFGQLGAVASEGFCERGYSNANDVVDEGNVNLDTRELEMIVILRMARKFMEFMRSDTRYSSQLSSMRQTMTEEREQQEREQWQEAAAAVPDEAE